MANRGEGDGSELPIEVQTARQSKNEKGLALNSNPYYRIYFPLIIKAIHYKEFQCAEAL